MDSDFARIEEVLNKVSAGELPIRQAAALLAGESNMVFARLDTARAHRRGLPEAIYCPGKTIEQIVAIAGEMKKIGQSFFATRASFEIYSAVKAAIPEARYHADARAVTADFQPPAPQRGLVAVLSAGTADISVAEEAALAAERMGARVTRIWDVGVAGLHRLMRHVDVLRSARAVVVVAGMEGALPSVAAGLTDRPVIAVPTSVGYGTGAGGLAALLSMLNTCVPGVLVVNIDNGFGAGVAAAMINALGESTPKQ